jgi:hypothetical protein
VAAGRCRPRARRRGRVHRRVRRPQAARRRGHGQPGHGQLQEVRAGGRAGAGAWTRRAPSRVQPKTGARRRGGAAGLPAPPSTLLHPAAQVAPVAGGPGERERLLPAQHGLPRPRRQRRGRAADGPAGRRAHGAAAAAAEGRCGSLLLGAEEGGGRGEPAACCLQLGARPLGPPAVAPQVPGRPPAGSPSCSRRRPHLSAASRPAASLALLSSPRCAERAPALTLLQVCVAADESPQSQAALQWAARHLLAGRSMAKLHIVTVAPSVPYPVSLLLSGGDAARARAALLPAGLLRAARLLPFLAPDEWSAGAAPAGCDGGAAARRRGACRLHACPGPLEGLSPSSCMRPPGLQIVDEGSAVVAAMESRQWQEEADRAQEGARALAARWAGRALRGGEGRGWGGGGERPRCAAACATGVPCWRTACKNPASALRLGCQPSCAALAAAPTQALPGRGGAGRGGQARRGQSTGPWRGLVGRGGRHRQVMGATACWPCLHQLSPPAGSYPPERWRVLRSRLALQLPGGPIQ